jgi:hypothetical protein
VRCSLLSVPWPRYGNEAPMTLCKSPDFGPGRLRGIELVTFRHFLDKLPRPRRPYLSGAATVWEFTV